MAAQNQVIVNLTANAQGFVAGASQAQKALANFNQGLAAAVQGNTRFRAANGQFISTVGAAKQVVAQLTAEKQKMLLIEQQLSGALSKSDMALLRSSGAIQGLSGATGSASFALLSLGQAFQDSAQFGMGFAQGLRAVNNNIQQVFTAIALGSIQAGGLKNLFAQMRGQLFGPAGLIIGFSLISAAAEFFATRAQRAEKETSRLNDALKESAEQMTEVSGIDKKKYEFQIENLGTVISKLEKELGLVQAVTDAKEKESLTNSYSYSQQLKLQDAVTKAENELNDATGVLTESQREAKKAVLEVLKTRLAEAEANKLIQAELERLGAREISDGMTLAEIRKQELADAEHRANAAKRLPPILEAEAQLFKDIGALQKAAEAAAKARELREFAIAQSMAEQVKAASDMATDALVLPAGELDLGNRLITDRDRAMQRLNKTLQDTAAQGMTQVVSGFAEMAFSGASFSAAILGPLADMAIRLGKIAIGTAIAMKGIKMSFKNPATALAAGVALVALGSAVKASIKRASGGEIGTSGGGGISTAGMIRGGAGLTEFNVGNLYGGTPGIGSAAGFPSLSVGSMAPSGMQIQLVARGPDLVSAVDAQRTANTRLIGGSR